MTRRIYIKMQKTVPPPRMTAFSKKDVKHLIEDLKLYSGNIAKITGIFFPKSSSDGRFNGVIHTWLDKFMFSAYPMFCDETTWRIHLSHPVESLRHGHRRILIFAFPKLHKNPKLQGQYQIANLVYSSYNNYSNVTEASRLPEYEKQLGYHKLGSYMQVLAAIVRDFRSHKEKLDFYCQRETLHN